MTATREQETISGQLSQRYLQICVRDRCHSPKNKTKKRERKEKKSVNCLQPVQPSPETNEAGHMQASASGEREKCVCGKIVDGSKKKQNRATVMI